MLTNTVHLSNLKWRSGMCLFEAPFSHRTTPSNFAASLVSRFDSEQGEFTSDSHLLFNMHVHTLVK